MKKILLLSSTLAALPAIAQDRPNIILFLVDDMGVMDTSVPFLTDKEGHTQIHPLNEWYHTPYMERLAQQGIRFSTFYAQSVSSPSRTSILTGQNAARTVRPIGLIPKATTARHTDHTNGIGKDLQAKCLSIPSSCKKLDIVLFI